jgi:hypothetical protein
VLEHLSEGKATSQSDGQASHRWRLLAKALSAIGIVLFAVSLIGSTFFEMYFAGHRPHTPQPGMEQTVRLAWTHPVSYGTARDARDSDGLPATSHMISVLRQTAEPTQALRMCFL